MLFRLILCCLLVNTGAAVAQQKGFTYTDARELTLIGKAWNSTPEYYHRVDTVAYNHLPPQVKRLLTHSSGLAISFRTNSTAIAATWCTKVNAHYNNMTAIAYEGLDIYIKRNNKWVYAGVGRPDTDTCNQFTLVNNMDTTMKECLVYLPIYDETKSLSIGVKSGATIAPAANPFKKNILIYGSSIVHGASASRPGMAYPARLCRQTGLNFINFGVSGNAKMEKEVADMIATLDMDAFILDCVPNCTPEQVTERTAYLVQAIRAKHPGKPIIAIQGIIRETGNFDQAAAEAARKQNANFYTEITALQKKDKDLYLITADNLLGDDHEGTTDGTHPNDIGFDRMIRKIGPAALKIFKKYGW